MKNIFKNSIRLFTAVLLAVTVMGSSVYASDEVFCNDSSGNWFGAGQLVDVSSKTDVVNNELFVAGMDVKATDMNVDGSVFAAGNTVTLTDITSGGSIFAAGSNVTVDAVANNNIWAAGANIIIGSDTAVKAVNVAGANVTAKGKYVSANISGDTVVFDAAVSGDVSIEANTITFGENASVGGNLKVTAPEDPAAGNIAKGSYDFEKSESNGDDTASAVEGSETLEKAGKAAGKAAFGIVILKKIKKAFFNLFKYALLALIFAIVLKKNLSDAYEYATKKPAPFWGFGALTLLVYPIVAIVLCITVIGLPLAGLCTTLYVLAICFAKVFTFASLVRELIFRNTSKRLNPVAETVLAVLPAAVIGVIPVIGGLVSFVCAVYTLGYVVLAIAETVSSNKTVKGDSAANNVEQTVENTDTVTEEKEATVTE